MPIERFLASLRFEQWGELDQLGIEIEKGSKETLGALTLRIGLFHPSGYISSSHQYKNAREDR